jgi:hypothetical protein
MPKPAGILEDLNVKNKFNYLYFPLGKPLHNVRVSIAKPKSQNTLPHPHHSITGNLGEIHSLYLAIENYLRIQTMLPRDLGVYRMSDDGKQQLYRVSAVTATQAYLHEDEDLDIFADGLSRSGNEIKKLQEEKSSAIQKYFVEKLGGLYTYYKTFTTKDSVCIKIGYVQKNDLSTKIRLIVEYKDKLQNKIIDRLIDANYTRAELIVLRFALLDFLEYQVADVNKFWVVRSGLNGRIVIRSKIQRRQTKSSFH